MDIERNKAIKSYISKYFVKEDEALHYVKKISSQENLPNIAVSDNVGKTLYILTKLKKPKRILEIGTLAGYSTLWFAKAAPEATIITLEGQKKHVEVAQNSFNHAKLSDRVQILEGNAQESLLELIEKKEKFDLIFLDANKEEYPVYLPLILKLAEKEALLLSDNLIPKKSEIEKPFDDDLEGIQIYHFNQLLASNPNIDSIILTNIVHDNGRIDGLGVSIIS